MSIVKCSIAALMTLLASCKIVQAYEVEFNDDSWTVNGVVAGNYDGNMPQHWISIGDVGVLSDRSGTQDTSALKFGFYSLSKGKVGQLRMGTDLSVPAEEIVCDNVIATLTLYVQPLQGNTVDTFQLIATTNDWVESSIFAIGQPIPIRDDSYETGWKTFTIKESIPGISDVGKYDALRIGIRATAGGKSWTYGYVHGVSVAFKAYATPGKPCLVDGDANELGREIPPGAGSPRMAVTVEVSPVDKIFGLKVYGVLSRDSGDQIVTITNELEKVGESYYEKLADVGKRPPFDSGEKISCSVFARYYSTVLALGEIGAGGVVCERSETVEYDVAKKGSVWINELVFDNGKCCVELCGTTNRVYTNGWQIVVSNADKSYTNVLNQVFDFSTNMINGAVGVETYQLNWGNLVLQNATLELKNSAGVVEFAATGLSLPAHYQMSGRAKWHGTDDGDWTYDWTGTANDGTFTFGPSTDPVSLGSVNRGQGFIVPVETMLHFTTLIENEGTPLPYAAVSADVVGILNGEEGITNFVGQTAEGTGTADIEIKGFCDDAAQVLVTNSVSAFAWKSDKVVSRVSLYEDIYLTGYVRPSVAYDDFSKLNDYWLSDSTIKNGLNKTMYWEVVDGFLQVDTRSGTRGIASLTTRSYMALRNKRRLQISFDFKNERNFAVSDCATFVVVVADRSDFSEGHTFETVGLANKDESIDAGSWYSFTEFLDVPAGFATDGKVWIRIQTTKNVATTSVYTTLDNLRIAAQDSVKVNSFSLAEPTGSAYPLELPSDVELDLTPLTAGITSNYVENAQGGEFALVTNSVRSVAAELVMSISGNEFVVPFKFPDGKLTNDVSAVQDHVLLKISPADLKAATGGFLAGDQVKYYARVSYDPDDADESGKRDIRYYPDNAVATDHGWYAKGGYLPVEQGFNLGGPAISVIGEPSITEDGISFDYHAWHDANITNLTVTVNANGSEVLSEEMETNDTTRVTNVFATDSLESNTEYTLTISGKGVVGNLAPATFTFVTLPKVPTAKIEAVSPTEVKLTATGNAAGFVVSPAGWTQQSVNTWTRNDGTPNQQFQASVYATNKVGAASAPAAATPGYTKSAAATKAPVAEKSRNTITVKADADYTVANDGNPEGTEYALGISTNGVDWVILSDDDGEIWKMLPDWQEHSETLSAPTINLNTTNNFKFVTRNFDGVVSADTPAVAKCWFDMEAYHVDGTLAQVANPFGTVKFDMELVDAAKSADAAMVIEYKIGNGAWKSAGAAVPVVFNELTITNSFSWDAWTAVGKAVGNYEYALRAKVKSDSSHRSSEWAQISGVLDFTPPTELAIIGTPTNGAITKSKNYTLAFSANDANEIAYTWTLDGVDGDGNELAGAVDDGVHMLKVRATDSMGNFSEATQTWTVDTQMPTNLAIAGTPEANAVTKATSFAFTASATDATALKYCWTLNGVAASTTSATYSGTAAEGTNTVSVYVVDAAGNRSATVKRTWVRDTTAPTAPVISGTPANGALTNSKAVNFTVQSTDATALTYHWSFKGADSTGTKLVGEGVEGANSVSVYATDAAGNRSTTTTRSWTVDTVAPTVALTSSTPNPFNAAKAPMVVTATFSEEVKNFTAASVTVVNGTVSAVSGSGAVYTVSITPKADGPVTVSIAANAVTDNAGNKNAASSTLTRTYDATKPTVTLTSSTPNPFNANDTFTVAVKFSETVKNFTAASVTVGNGTVSAVSGSGKDYTLTITPSADGEVSVQIGADKVTDEAGNGNVASAVLKRQCDTTKPTVALASSTPNPFNATKAPMQVTVTFSEPVTNFTASSVSVGNGRVTGVSGSAAAYTMTVNPTADGPVTVSVAAGVVADAAGNGNTASSTLTRTYDVTPPMVELSSETSERFNEAAAPMTVKVVFNEPVTNFTAASVTVLNGTVGSVAEAEDAENTYLVDINPTADGTVSVSVGAGVVADAAGNGNVSSQALARIYDNVKPTVALTSETPGSFNGAAAPLTVKVVFSESVTNFTASAVTVVNGTVDAVVEAEDVENAYLVDVTPAADGTVSVSVGAGVVADAAGNGNEASNELKRLYDNVQPTAELSSETPQLFNANDVFTVKVVFSEAVTNFTAVSVAVVNGTVAKVVEVEDEDNAYLVTVNPTADGQVTVSIPGGVVADEAGNGNAVSESLMRTCDKTRPTVKITTTMQMNVAFSASTLEQDPFVAKVEFSEPVTGFAASSVTIVNGTIKGTMSNVGSNTYRFEVSPSAEGPVIISIAEGVVSDSAGNLNEASTSLTRVYDNVPPTTPVITGSPENGTTTGSRTFALTARSEDASGIVYFWFVNGEPVSGSYGNELTGLAKEGLNEIEVYAIDDADNLSSSAFWTWIYDAGSASGDVEFGGGVCVKVDSDTGATNSVAFTMVDFNPDSTSTLTMSGFSATTQELTEFQLWLVVGSLDGARWRVKVDDHANFNAEKGELTVTLPAKALKKQDGSEYEQLFIFGIDNQNSPE